MKMNCQPQGGPTRWLRRPSNRNSQKVICEHHNVCNIRPAVGGLGHSTENASKFIDDRLLQVCAFNTIKPVSVVPSMPVSVGAYVRDNLIIIDVESDKIIDNEIEVVVRLSGIRAGAAHKRFATHTYEEMVKNNTFWSRWKEG